MLTDEQQNAIVATACVAVLVAVAFYFSYAGMCSVAPSPPNSGESRLADLTGDLASYTKWLFFATFALALATAGLVRLGFIQARDLKRLTDTGERASKSCTPPSSLSTS
jgi:hypothetical protein